MRDRVGPDARISNWPGSVRGYGSYFTTSQLRAGLAQWHRCSRRIHPRSVPMSYCYPATPRPSARRSRAKRLSASALSRPASIFFVRDLLNTWIASGGGLLQCDLVALLREIGLKPPAIGAHCPSNRVLSGSSRRSAFELGTVSLRRRRPRDPMVACDDPLEFVSSHLWHRGRLRWSARS
jgi:hypothetical protein